ncbi:MULTISPECIES: holo-ACP synthase [unclassified Agarivorans]|uniref:holo-ACP synthase n=1 Tax=unclassified Agarivorans TaxID=2636026 RepID=UPI0010DB6938|nr:MULTISPECIES: holo-ACP synthase [unclassified Agarivorans]MDO6684300.1 holo-ACP synthase [Agarivorans sp. 3_MG-2023]MDO6714465.1 holo-ACP synthase [Agarivorans sp. 2_MG-2023]MDO6763146.1 holo-ACP synthase [Agarivorans sp. 1_MG-2023]GDY24429.1 holo-[acyl-carrier-protein] synthase [Agarivorans sp. Toyoura001]
MAVVGLGTDIVQVARIANSKQMQALAKRVLTESEQLRFAEHSSAARFLAKRFAAKEAAAKALGTGIAKGVGFQQIEISNNQLGKPELHFSGAALALAEQLGVTSQFISISDERDYAVATVVLERE